MIKFAFSFLIILLVFLMTGCVNPFWQDAEEEIFNRQLLDAYQAYEQTMSGKRNPLHFESGQVVDNCADYLQQSKISTITEGVNNRIVSQEYIICASVSLIKAANRHAGLRYQPDSYGKALFKRLDLRTFPSSIRQMADDKHFVLSSLDSIPSKADKYSVVSDTDDWFFKIEVVADTDLDGDGKRDWLLWLIDEAKNGNYRGYSVLTINTVSEAGFLAAEVSK